MPADVITAAPSESISGATTGDNLSDMAFLDQTLASVHKDDASADAAVEDAPVEDGIDAAIAAETGQKPVVVDPNAPPAPDAVKPDETKPAEVKPTDAATDEETGDETSLTVASLQKRVSTNPELKKIVDADPDFKRQLFYTARRADRATKYDDLFQTPDLAREAKTAADDMFTQRDLYTSNPEKFLQKIWSDSLVKDDQGRVRVENGVPVTNGAYDAAMQLQRSYVWSAIETQAKQMIASNAVGDNFNGHDVMEALRILRAVADGAPAGAKADHAEAEANLPESVRAELAEARRMKADRSADAAKTLETFTTSTNQKMSEVTRTDVKNLLSKRLPPNNALTDYLKEKVVDDTVRELEKLASGNRAHMDFINRSMRSVQRNEDGTKTIVAARQGFVKELAPRILARFLQQATNAVVTQNNTTRSQVQRQNRPEVVSSGGGSNPSRPDARKAGEKVISDASKTGRFAKDEDVVNAVLAAQGRS